MSVIVWATLQPLVLARPPTILILLTVTAFSPEPSPNCVFFRQYAWLSSSLFRKYNKAWCWSPPYGRPACHQTFATQLKDVYAVLYQRDSSSSAALRPLVSMSPWGQAAGVREPGPRSKKNTRSYTLSHALNLSAPCCSETLNSVRLSACSSYTHHTLDLDLPEPLMVMSPAVLCQAWGYCKARALVAWKFLALVLGCGSIWPVFDFLVVRMLFLMNMPAKCWHSDVECASARCTESLSLICTRYILPDVHLSVLTHQPWIS